MTATPITPASSESFKFPSDPTMTMQCVTTPSPGLGIAI